MNIKFILLFVLLLIIYISILSFNLLKLPLYLDEGLYIFWASLFKENSALAYISMQDGKTPLFIWLTYYLDPYFNNYLFTARFISVIASSISLSCAAFITWRITAKKEAAFIVFLLFLITPFNSLISRMAFVDSLLVAFGSLSLVCLLMTREFALKKRVIISLLFGLLVGLFLGIAFMTKTTARLFLIADILVILLWFFEFIKSKQYKSAIILAASVPVILGLYYEILGYLRFGSLKYWEMISNKESALVFSLPEIVSNFFRSQGLTFYLKNLPLFSEYFLIYFGPLLLFFILGVFRILKDRKQLWLILIFSIFSVGVFLSAKILASRYLAIIIPEFIIISSIGLIWIWQKKSQVLRILTIVLLCSSAIMSFKLIADPINAFYASDDKSYFVESDINALGLQEIIKYLEPQNSSSVIGIEGIWGVNEGMLTSLTQKGIETQLIKRIIPVNGEDSPICNQGFLDQEKLCWKANFGDIIKNPKTNKYIYLSAEPDQIEFLKKLANIKIVKEFKRPGINKSAYFIELSK